MTSEKCHSKRWCFVPTCRNTGLNCDKLFVGVPKHLKSIWFSAVGRECPKSKTRYFCCEDHFNMSEDAENWSNFITKGDRLKMKRNILPHKFDCETDSSACCIVSPYRKRKLRGAKSVLSNDTNSEPAMKAAEKLANQQALLDAQNATSSAQYGESSHTETNRLSIRTDLSQFSLPECVTIKNENELDNQTNYMELSAINTLPNSTIVSNEQATWSSAAEVVKQEVEIEEGKLEIEEVNPEYSLRVQPNVEVAPGLKNTTSQSEIVFTFESRHAQPTQDELSTWLTEVMFLGNPRLLQTVDTIKLMNGCFILRIKHHFEQTVRHKVLQDIVDCFNEVRYLSSVRKWKMERYDIVPGLVWVKVSNLPTWVSELAITQELSKFGEVRKIVTNRILPNMNGLRISDGNVYLRMDLAELFPNDLLICGGIAWLSFCDAPDS